MNTLDMRGRTCPVLGDVNARIRIIQPMDDHELEALNDEIALIVEYSGEASFLLAAVPVRDWNAELSPWPAPPVFGREPFAGRADALLQDVIETLLPALSARHPVEDPAYVIGGYSLAGLFALYAAYRTGLFHGVAAVSPSLWYPDWSAFADSRAIGADCAYLSLGDREERARNPVMARVGDGVRAEYQRLKAALGNRAALEWNPGNHFNEPERRTAKGLGWVVRRMNEREQAGGNGSHSSQSVSNTNL